MNKENLMLILVLFGGIFYLYGIGKASYYSIKNTPDKMPVFLINTLTSISAILTGNLGAVLGLTITEDTEFYGQGLIAWKLPPIEAMQMYCAYFYFACLIIVFIVWAIKNFTEDTLKVVKIIPSLNYTLFGIVGGVIAIAVGAQL
jgi:hypothetical protein